MSPRRVVLISVFVLLAACGQSVFEIAVGQCLNLPDGAEVSTVESVDCAQPHQAEAFHEFSLNEGAFPGDNVVSEQANRACEPEFEGYVGVAFIDSPDLYFQTLVPTSESWADGDREVVCLLVTGDGTDLTGSRRGNP